MEKEEGLLVKELVHKPKYYNAVEVRLYDTSSNMFKAAKRWNKENKNKYALSNDYDAVTLENLPDDIRRIGGNQYCLFSTIFLCKEKLSYGILLHEFGHATFILFRNIHRFDCKFERVTGTGCDEEEFFCYTQEDFFKMFLNILKKKKIEIEKI
jgi:hypothetical protein